MECNKDEAIRAKEIAEKKMQSNDFEGARKIAQKAQNLCPELENITQLLSICDVHCSAHKLILGSEKDWYGILQVEKLSDELVVKKQYRRLALNLHPDKNRFPGAEAAFKLIGEANMVLSDPVKKSLYDSRVKVSLRAAAVNPPTHHINKNSQSNKQQYGVQKNNVSYNNLNQQQATRQSSSVRLDVFWTSCPFCSVRYQYHRQFVNRALRCQTCSKPFTAYEIGAQGVPLGSKPGAQHVPLKPDLYKTATSQPKVVPNHKGVQNQKGSSVSHEGSQGTSRSGNANFSHSGKEYQTSNGNPANRESGVVNNRSRKRGRKIASDSSESFDSSDESDDVEDVTMKVPVTDVRRSSRKRQHVSYNENDEDDVANPLKRSQENLQPDGNENKQKGDLGGGDPKRGNQNSVPSHMSASKENQTSQSEKSMQDEDADRDKEGKARGKTSSALGTAAGTVEIESDTKHESTENADRDKEGKARGKTGSVLGTAVGTVEIKSDTKHESTEDSDEDVLHCPDPDFSDFDKMRNESCFEVNQFWAAYDTLDGMPRFYAKVKKLIRASPFELTITWLEAQPIDEASEKWIDEELPVGCGRFKFGQSDKITSNITFSHQVHIQKGKDRGTLVVYPRQGEIWALFRDWDMSWSSEPENRKEFKYEIVEVLSDFVEGTGIRVAYLDKVVGFVSLFQRTSQSDTNSLLVGPKELYKLSHRVPHFIMSGSERVGVPKGSFELDPAALPLNPDDLYYPSKAKMENKNMDPGVQSSHPGSAEKKGNSLISEDNTTPKKPVDLGGMNGEMSTPRRSTRVSNVKQNAN